MSLLFLCSPILCCIYLYPVTMAGCLCLASNGNFPLIATRIPYVVVVASCNDNNKNLDTLISAETIIYSTAVQSYHQL